MKRHFWALLATFIAAACLCSTQLMAKGDITLIDHTSWHEQSASFASTELRSTNTIGGGADLMGAGSLMLKKQDQSVDFWKTTDFVKSGVWTSTWFDSRYSEIDIEWYSYGQSQSMSNGWTKFAGNPLVSEHNWVHATEQTLQLPSHYSERPNDQSLELGRGEYAGKWLLFFNIGGWAVKGWGMAVADTLDPIKQGINPFKLSEPFPLTKATGGYNAPNDWFYHEGKWYAPDESRDHTSRMWTSPDTVSWKLEGPIDGINGHDPGMTWDGEYFYLFNESNNKITLVRSKDPLGKWQVPLRTKDSDKGSSPDVAIDVNDHTGDADLAYFNNRWHMFMDDGEHFHYNLAYAWTTGEEFPYGWRLSNDVFGPHKPEQGQRWDDDNEQGNGFGTGDADIALDGNTLYMTYERPIGIAYKELELQPTAEQAIEVQAEYTDQGVVGLGPWVALGQDLSTLDVALLKIPESSSRWRLNLKLITEDASVSPMVKKISLSK